MTDEILELFVFLGKISEGRVQSRRARDPYATSPDDDIFLEFITGVFVSDNQIQLIPSSFSFFVCYISCVEENLIYLVLSLRNVCF